MSDRSIPERIRQRLAEIETRLKEINDEIAAFRTERNTEVSSLAIEAQRLVAVYLDPVPEPPREPDFSGVEAVEEPIEPATAPVDGEKEPPSLLRPHEPTTESPPEQNVLDVLWEAKKSMRLHEISRATGLDKDFVRTLAQRLAEKGRVKMVPGYMWRAL